MSKANTLKPCPFCGSPAHPYVNNGRGHYILCSFCGAETSGCVDLETATSRWNRRPESKKSGARIVVDLVDGRNCVKTNLETELEHASENEKLMALELTHLFIKSLKEIQESRK